MCPASKNEYQDIAGVNAAGA